jgi:ferredoxin-NAD(P)+ reductase (naphthalene dioxygenase ferredoxin-specific)
MLHSVKVAPAGQPSLVDQGETVLEALIRDGIDYPHGCTTGVCGLCKSRLIRGEVELTQYYPSILTDEERAAGLTLICCAKPLSDCTISPVQANVILPPVRSVSAKISRIESLTHDIRRVVLRPSDGQSFQFFAGQYVSLATDGLPAREFSMANMPGSAELEFFIRRVPRGAFTAFVFEQAAVDQTLTVAGPYGMAFLREGHIGPIIAAAGGSGLAPLRSIILTALAHGMTQPINLFIGVRAERDIYLEEELRELQIKHPNLSVSIVLSDPGESSERRVGLLHETLLDGMESGQLSESCAYVAGPPIMVDAVSKALIEHGLPASSCHADPFLTAVDKIQAPDRLQGGERK